MCPVKGRRMYWGDGGAEARAGVSGSPLRTALSFHDGNAGWVIQTIMLSSFFCAPTCDFNRPCHMVFLMERHAGPERGPPTGFGPMVSVIVPTFNRSAQVVEAVRSVLGQRQVPAQVVVVDDGSTDDTPDALRTFGSGVRLIRQPRRGVSAARNRGVLEAEHPWIAFLDSDDLWLPGKLSAQMEYLSMHPEIRICQTEEIWLRHGRRLNPKKYHKKPHGHCFHCLLDRCLVSPSAVMMHRSLFDEAGGFDEDLVACEDYDLWLRIGLRHPIGLVEKALVVKRGGHPDQLSSCIPSLDRFRIRALFKILDDPELTGECRQLALDALGRKARVYVTGLKKRGRLEEAASIEEAIEDLSHGCG